MSRACLPTLKLHLSQSLAFASWIRLPVQIEASTKAQKANGSLQGKEGELIESEAADLVWHRAWEMGISQMGVLHPWEEKQPYLGGPSKMLGMFLYQAALLVQRTPVKPE